MNEKWRVWYGPITKTWHVFAPNGDLYRTCRTWKAAYAVAYLNAYSPAR